MAMVDNMETLERPVGGGGQQGNGVPENDYDIPTMLEDSASQYLPKLPDTKTANIHMFSYSSIRRTTKLQKIASDPCP